MERLFVSANFYKGPHKIKFVCVRYGNVMGSRGSVIPVFVNQVKTGQKITVTDPNMTRFNITMNEALDLIFRALKNGKGGEIFVPKLKAYRVGNIKDAIIEILEGKNETEITSIRPGEKIHESLLSFDELNNSFENEQDYVIIDKQIQNLISKENGLGKTTLQKQYSSDSVTLLTKSELKELLIKEKLV